MGVRVVVFFLFREVSYVGDHIFLFLLVYLACFQEIFHGHHEI